MGKAASKLKLKRCREAQLAVVYKAWAEASERIACLHGAFLDLYFLVDKINNSSRSEEWRDLEECAENLEGMADTVNHFHLQLEAVMDVVLADYGPHKVEMADR